MSDSRKQIVITRIDDKPVSAYLIGERIYDLLVRDEKDDIPNVGDIYVGRVKHVVDNISAAFVEIREGVVGYLPLSKTQRKSVKGEQEIIVQIKKPAKGTKDAVLTTSIELVGRYVILQEGAPGIHVSRKLRDEEEIKRLSELLADRSVSAGITIRTNAANAEEDRILQEYDRLQGLWETIHVHGSQRKLYSVLYRESPFYIRQINSYPAEMIDRIVTDQQDVFEELCELGYAVSEADGLEQTATDGLNLTDAEGLNLTAADGLKQTAVDELNLTAAGGLNLTGAEDRDPSESASADIRLEFYQDTSYPLDARYAISTTIKKAEDRLVWLKSGANLIIDRTEAMTVIDVNSAKAVDGKRASESTFFKVNLEAAKEVARQLRLRNLSGIILVDFIDMKEQEHIDALIAALRDCLREDPVKAMYVDMTKLGIIEITRSKQFS